MRPPRPPRDLDPELSRPGLRLNRIQGILARYAAPDRARRNDSDVPIAAVCRPPGSAGPDAAPGWVVFASAEAARHAANALRKVGLEFDPVPCAARPPEFPHAAGHFHLRSQRAASAEPRDPAWQPRIRKPYQQPLTGRTLTRPAALPAPLTTPRSSTR